MELAQRTQCGGQLVSHAYDDDYCHTTGTLLVHPHVPVSEQGKLIRPVILSAYVPSHMCHSLSRFLPTGLAQSRVHRNQNMQLHSARPRLNISPAAHRHISLFKSNSMSHPVFLILNSSRLAKLAIKTVPAAGQSPDLLYQTGEIRSHHADKVTANLA